MRREWGEHHLYTGEIICMILLLPAKTLQFSIDCIPCFVGFDYFWKHPSHLLLWNPEWGIYLPFETALRFWPPDGSEGLVEEILPYRASSYLFCLKKCHGYNCVCTDYENSLNHFTPVNSCWLVVQSCPFKWDKTGTFHGHSHWNRDLLNEPCWWFLYRYRCVTPEMGITWLSYVMSHATFINVNVVPLLCMPTHTRHVHRHAPLVLQFSSALFTQQLCAVDIKEL